MTTEIGDTRLLGWKHTGELYKVKAIGCDGDNIIIIKVLEVISQWQLGWRVGDERRLYGRLLETAINLPFPSNEKTLRLIKALLINERERLT